MPSYILYHSMSYAVITTKIDPQTKKEAQITAEELGMPLSVVIKAFLKQFVRTKTVTFSVENEEPSEYLIKVMKQAEKDWRAGKGSPVFKTGEEAVAWVDKQRILIFSKNPNELQLNNHALKKEWKVHRSMDINTDYRAVYKKVAMGDELVAHFVTLGTHDELYN